MCCSFVRVCASESVRECVRARACMLVYVSACLYMFRWVRRLLVHLIHLNDFISSPLVNLINLPSFKVVNGL